MALPFQYSFGGSEAPLATHWSLFAGYGCKENGSDALPNNTSVSCWSYVDDESFANDQYCEIGITSLANFPGCMARTSGTDCYYCYVRSAGDRLYVRRWNNGSNDDLVGGAGYISTTISAGQRLRIEVTGTGPATIKVFAGAAGSLTQRGSDISAAAGNASGACGIFTFGMDSTTGTISDVDCGDLGGAPPATRRALMMCMGMGD